jgi:hypothetical protein
MKKKFLLIISIMVLFSNNSYIYTQDKKEVDPFINGLVDKAFASVYSIVQDSIYEGYLLLGKSVPKEYTYESSNNDGGEMYYSHDKLTSLLVYEGKIRIYFRASVYNDKDTNKNLHLAKMEYMIATSFFKKENWYELSDQAWKKDGIFVNLIDPKTSNNITMWSILVIDNDYFNWY